MDDDDDTLTEMTATSHLMATAARASCGDSLSASVLRTATCGAVIGSGVGLLAGGGVTAAGVGANALSAVTGHLAERGLKANGASEHMAALGGAVVGVAAGVSLDMLSHTGSMTSSLVQNGVSQGVESMGDVVRRKYNLHTEGGPPANSPHDPPKHHALSMK